MINDPNAEQIIVSTNIGYFMCISLHVNNRSLNKFDQSAYAGFAQICVLCHEFQLLVTMKSCDRKIQGIVKCTNTPITSYFVHNMATLKVILKT